MTLLLIDDDTSCTESLKRALERAGHCCTSCNDPYTGVDAYCLHPYDVVVTDYKMPGMDGLQVLKTLRGRDREACVFMLTGYVDQELTSSAWKEGVTGLFSKPLDIVGFLETLERMEGRRVGEL